MTVWIVTIEERYEGAEIKGVYATQVLARAKAAKLTAPGEPYEGSEECVRVTSWDVRGADEGDEEEDT